jgi:hypothetical protein
MGPGWRASVRENDFTAKEGINAWDACALFSFIKKIVNIS